MATESNHVDERPVLYLNIIIHDGREIIKEKIKRKVEDSNVLPKAIKPMVARRSANFASRNVKPSTIAQQISDKMIKTIPKKLMSQGLTVDMREVFREGPYVVLQLQVQHVDMIAMDKSIGQKSSAGSSRDKTPPPPPPPKPKEQQKDNETKHNRSSSSNTVISSLTRFRSSKNDNSTGTNNNNNTSKGGVSTATDNKGNDDDDNESETKESSSANTIAGALLQWTYSIIGTKNQTMIERGYLPNKVQDKLQKGMADMLATTFQEKKLHAETCVLKETRQARFFYDKLQQIRSEEESRKESKRRLLFSRSSSFLKSATSSSNNNNTNGVAASPISGATVRSIDDNDD